MAFFIRGAVNSKGNAYDTKYLDYKDGYLTIATEGTRKVTPYHEIGHLIEWANPNVLRIEKNGLITVLLESNLSV